MGNLVSASDGGLGTETKKMWQLMSQEGFVEYTGFTVIGGK